MRPTSKSSPTCPARKEPFAAVESKSTTTVPAVKLQLNAPEMGLLPEQWLAGEESHRRVRAGPALLEFLARDCIPGQLAEFKSPPAPKERGAAGQLVVGIAADVWRFDVARVRARDPQPLAATGWSLRVLDYLPNHQQPGDPTPSDPAVSFELIAPQGNQVGFATTARRGGDLFPLPGYVKQVDGPTDFWVWYHPADPRYGDDSLRGMLQMATTATGTLWFRSWATRKGAPTGENIGFEGAQRANLDGTRQRLWTGMNWKLQVLEYLPDALAKPWYKRRPRARVARRKKGLRHFSASCGVGKP